MKKYLKWIFYLVILGLSIWGMINPEGIRAAAANNKWSLDFVDRFYDENSTWQALPKPPSSHPHAKLLLAREAIDSGDDDLAALHCFTDHLRDPLSIIPYQRGAVDIHS